MSRRGISLPVLFIDFILLFTDFRNYAVIDRIYYILMLMAIMWGALVHQSSWYSLVDGSWRHLIAPLNCIFEIDLLTWIARKMCSWSMNRGDKKKDLPLLSSRQRCLGVCILMFCSIAEGFMDIALWLLPLKAPSDSKFWSRAENKKNDCPKYHITLKNW